ncbi:MAG: hypothetical protein CL666_14795 [Balneola sp.]|nr:hypothetical protein [Balneola sp.]|tara:strand:+ start:36412 stop:36999 length:588 start_codon:yes stop_codon:yes gene_type:complete
MNCPNCGEQPYTFLESLFPGKEEFKRNFKGQYTCRSCGTVLTYKKNQYGFFDFKSEFYVILSILIILILTLTWAVIINMDDIFTFSSPAISMALLFTATLAIGLGGGALARKYVILEIYDSEKEEKLQKKSVTGMIVFMSYAILAIFGFGFLSKWANDQSLSPYIYVGGTLVYLAVVSIIALKMMNSSLFKKQQE